MLLKVFGYITTAVTVLSLYRFVFVLIGFFSKSKIFPPANTQKKYGIIISARNESAVIGNLLDSIKEQDYDLSYITVFVVADNCNDNTADICRERGAVVYERYDSHHARKGYALEYLFDKIDNDYGINNFDCFIFFDADNLLCKNFISEINKAMSTDTDICIGYRNTKNFSQNIISASYGIHFMRSSFFLHRPRSLLRMSTHIAGTGWAVKSSLLRNGWHCTYLTEDTQFTMDSIINGKKIEFCEAAEFYDEQPHEIQVAVRQRIRWIKGRLACFISAAPRLLSGIFQPGKPHLSCYDMFMYLFPAGLFSFFCVTLPTAAETLRSIIAGNTAEETLLNIAETAVTALAAYWIFSVVTGALVLLREHHHIQCSVLKQIFFLIFWPWYDFIELPLGIISLFIHVKWKPIKHDYSVSLQYIEKKNTAAAGKK
jgi:hypothetical protein